MATTTATLTTITRIRTILMERNRIVEKESTLLLTLLLIKFNVPPHSEFRGPISKQEVSCLKVVC